MTVEIIKEYLNESDYKAFIISLPKPIEEYSLGDFCQDIKSNKTILTHLEKSTYISETSSEDESDEPYTIDDYLEQQKLEMTTDGLKSEHLNLYLTATSGFEFRLNNKLEAEITQFVNNLIKKNNIYSFVIEN